MFDNNQNDLYTDLTDCGLDHGVATRLGIMVPMSLDSGAKKRMVEHLNALSVEEQEKLWKIRLDGANLNGTLSNYQFTEGVRNVSASKSGGGNTSAYAGAFVTTGITEYSRLVKDSASKIDKLDKVFRSRIDSVPEILREAKTKPRIAKLVAKYPKNSLYQLQTIASENKISRSNFRQLFKPFLDDINEASLSLRKGSMHILSDRMSKINKLLNANDTKPIAAAMKKGTILADLEDVKALARYAKIGKYATKGLIGVNIITTYSNLATVSNEDFAKTFAGDTGALLGSSAGTAAGAAAVSYAADIILGETLLCCGPVGWGVLLVGVITGVVVGCYGSKGGEWLGDKIWIRWGEPNKDSIKNWLTMIGKSEMQRVRNGYY